jgi:hypothetical protein
MRLLAPVVLRPVEVQRLNSSAFAPKRAQLEVDAVDERQTVRSCMRIEEALVRVLG